MAKRKQKQKNKKQNKFKTDNNFTFSSARSADIDKVAYQVFGALTYSSKKSF